MLEEEIPLHFTQKEVAILANCVGKTIAGTRSIPVNDSEMAHIDIDFTDGTAISLSSSLELMPYDLYEGSNGYEEAATFRLTNRLDDEHNSCQSYDIPEDILPVTRTIRRAYVVNETIAYSVDKKSAIHTYGIVFVFWDDNDPNMEAPYYFYAHQENWLFEYIACGVTRKGIECIKYDFESWTPPDIFSTSMIRVG